MSRQQKLVVVCEGKSCTQHGAKRIVKAFKDEQLQNVEIRTKYCFGKCGNGPMVVILPEEVWYARVRPEQVILIIARHFS